MIAAQARPVATVLVQLVVYGALIWAGVLAWRDETRRRKARAELDRLGHIDTTPRLPPPPIRFDRDPSPRKQVDA